ncbi:hypothetical protein RUM43_011123 [Polyplax serrata]|uniref:OTU domain-containing protein n=1 Tax=Polyplax serrata TaxID=468196 RepID=A0AAN8PES5_POLSC
MDVWLDGQGLYRKNTALDGTCLFRAVADQLFSYHVPNGHVLLREQCVKFMRENRHMFESKVISGPFDEYLDNLSDLKQWAGQLELEALSLIYGVDFLVFKSIDLAPIPATQNGYERKIMLCFTPDNFYDAVYPKSYIENAGFCQSIVYGILYRGVFKLEDLEYAVEKMLHDKSARARREKYLNSQSQGREDSIYDFYLEDSLGPINMKELLDMGAILFPYKVAKALDPDIYRNIDFDNWVDTLRVPRKNSFCFGNGGPLRVGVKCLLKLDENRVYNAHVQEMSPDCGPVLVFVEEIGEKLTVRYENLEPLPRTSLKPEWTFSHKHQIINKFRELGITNGDDCNKNKSRNKNRKGKNGIKYPPMLERKKDNSDHLASSDVIEQNRQNENNRSKNDSNGSVSSNSTVVIAEPDSTTSSYGGMTPNSPPAQAYYGNNVILTPCGWTSPTPQPQVVKTVNLMVNKSVKVDCTDLPLSDLETIRFFFNLGIDYFRMGCLVWPSSPTCEENNVTSKSPATVSRTVTKSPEAGKLKLVKNQKKPPRFMKMDSVESNKIEKPQRSGSTEDDYSNEITTDQPQQQQPPPPLPQQPIPFAIPFNPQYAVQYPTPYHLPGYPIPPVQETTVPVETAPIATIGYSEHPPHYVEPSYTIPYMVYAHPQYYYSN